jgi:hypothetical protein
MKQLIQHYLDAKAAETLAIEARVQLGNEIAARLGAPTEGSQTHEVDGYKVTVRQPVNRRVDWEQFDKLTDGWEAQQLPVIQKRELDAKGVRWLQDNMPEAYTQIAKAITATPGRVAVEIKTTNSKE